MPILLLMLTILRASVCPLLYAAGAASKAGPGLIDLYIDRAQLYPSVVGLRIS